MRSIHTLVLSLLLISTVALYGQSQETTDAIQNQRLANIESDADITKENVEMLTRELAGLRSSLDRFTGMGMGMGAALTALQGLLVIITIRNGKKG